MSNRDSDRSATLFMRGQVRQAGFSYSTSVRASLRPAMWVGHNPLFLATRGFILSRIVEIQSRGAHIARPIVFTSDETILDRIQAGDIVLGVGWPLLIIKGDPKALYRAVRQQSVWETVPMTSQDLQKLLTESATLKP